VVLVGAAGIAQFESPAAVRAENPGSAPGTGIPSYGAAVWWTALILTTFGSDYWPQTVEGRVVCWLRSLYALGVFGYITATLASHFVGTAAPDRGAAPAPQRAALPTEVAARREQIAVLHARLPAPARPGATGPAPAKPDPPATAEAAD
jgi:voltage-gated potassium channel